MSIYGGFPTRSLESAYNHYLCEILNLFQHIVVDYLKLKQTPEVLQWCETFSNNFYKLSKLERQKHLLPKFSESIKDLENYIKSFSSSSNIEKYSERPSLRNTSTVSLTKQTPFKKLKSFKERFSSISSSRNNDSRELSLRPSRNKRAIKIKSYQDEILKSILQDLSNPYV